jgi:hypothetical protein
MYSKVITTGALLIIAAIVAAAVFGVSKKAQAPAPAATSTPPQSATSTPPQEPPPPEPAEGEEGGPSITLTPYTVYLGFATRYGTSSRELMGYEGTQVVVGYEWESLPDSPMFDSVELPQWGEEDTEYEIEVWDDGAAAYVLLGEFPAGEEVQFPRDGLNGPRKFKVTGISPTLRICPGDRSFNWQVRFTFPWDIGLVRTPITQDLLVVSCKMR